MEDKKLVEFENYCPKCKHWELPADSKPCSKCLCIPAREFSHKPEYYEEAK